VGRYFANLIATHTVNTGFDTITYVASTGASQRQRGYNQAKIIAKELSIITGLPLQNMLLRQSHQDQIGLNRAQRLAGVQGNFVPTSYSAHGKRILIVDDVVTTGATLNECARILKENGASRVWGVAVAKK
jgi:competence protein ComFC